MFVKRAIAIVAVGLVLASAFADSSIHLSAYPSVSVADSRSTVTITAEVRDQNGKAVQDGTRVVFSTNSGEFRQETATTVNGIARAVLRAGSVAGFATITATSLSGDASPSTLQYEFVASRELLNEAKDYVEIVAPGYMQYTVDSRKVAAADPNGKVSVRYRGIVVTAQDVQYDINSYELKARKAHLKMGTIDQDFDELFLQLQTKFGYGTTKLKVRRADGVEFMVHGLAFVRQGTDGKYTIPPLEDKYGLAEIHAGGIVPAPQSQSTTLFTFDDLSASPSTISAKKALIFPHREIQFQRAQIYVANQKVTTFPLYEIPLTGVSSPLITDDVLSVNNSQLGINFPYYLSLRPGQTSLFRFVTGQVDGRSDTSDHGAFLDYELKWNRGDDMDGGLIVSGIGRNDWALGVNQFIRFNDTASASAQLLTPSGRSFLGSGSVSQQFNGFSASINGSATQTITGIQYRSEDYSAIIEKDPIKVGALPLRLNLGLTATADADQLDHSSQSGAGATMRLQSLPLTVDRSTTALASFTTQYLSGQNELHGLQYLANLSLTKRLAQGASVTMAYDFTRDGFNEYVLGEHRLSLQGTFNRGNLNSNIFGARSLDLERSNLFADVSYRLSRSWRLTSTYTFDKYLSDTYLDYTFGIGYRIGWREVGLVWSEQTRRIGFQFLGVSVY